MKKIEITPEWILNKFPISEHAPGDGDIILTTGSVEASFWIDLALDTLGILYETDVMGFDPESEPQDDYFEIYWIFEIEDIKQDCPKLHAKWLEMHFNNLFRDRKN